jgi:outer membrane biosynthesis protein TonB
MVTWRHVRLRSTAISVGGRMHAIDAEGFVVEPSPAAVEVMRRHPNYAAHTTAQPRGEALSPALPPGHPPAPAVPVEPEPEVLVTPSPEPAPAVVVEPAPAVVVEPAPAVVVEPAPAVVVEPDISTLSVKELRALAQSMGLPLRGNFSASSLRARITEARGG